MILWTPDQNTISKANVSAFIKVVEAKQGITFDDFHSFREWTVNNSEKFWSEIADFMKIKFSKKAKEIISGDSLMPRAEWFKEAELNFAENVLRNTGAKAAIISWNEQGRDQSYSFDELHKKVFELQKFFISKGIKKGDVIAGYMPNIPETIFAFLAAASLGAVWTSCSSDFSASAVSDRFLQAEPKILITVDGYFYKGKLISILENITEISQKLKSLNSVLILPKTNKKPEIGNISNAVLYSDILTENIGKLHFEKMPAESPLFILYSSGTTGKPKCIVHSTVGILLEHLKEHALEVDIKAEDVVFYNTTCGWMMWNWLVSVLYQGASIVLYEGFALQNKGQLVFDMLEKEGVTIFGTSAAYLQKIKEIDLKPNKTHDLSKLKSILSTGSRLKPELFDYVYDSIGKMHLCPIWGGTDLCGCLGLSSVVLPVRRGEIQTRGLGIDVDVVDENCHSVRNIAGEVIVRKPFPSMPLYFLKDPLNEKYEAAYFNNFRDAQGRKVWRHGDLAILNDSNGVDVLGRSDDTLNPGGVRIGAAEVTSAVDTLPQISESIAVSQVWKNDERIILFVILKSGNELTEELKSSILQLMPTPRHRPKKIIAVSDFPVTLSGKRTIKTLRDIINGKEVSNLSALANPSIVEYFKSLSELKKD